MRTYSLAALILATVGTGLLSGIVLFAALSQAPDLASIDSTVLDSNMKSANRLLDSTFWFWAVVFVASSAVVLTAGGVLTKARIRHHLLCKFALNVAIVLAVQFVLDLIGLHTFGTAIARVNSPVGADITNAGWSTPDRDRVLLAGAALVALIYAIAFCLQLGHDNRGTDRAGIVE